MSTHLQVDRAKARKFNFKIYGTTLVDVMPGQPIIDIQYVVVLQSLFLWIAAPYFVLTLYDVFGYSQLWEVIGNRNTYTN